MATTAKQENVLISVELKNSRTACFEDQGDYN